MNRLGKLEVLQQRFKHLYIGIEIDIAIVIEFDINCFTFAKN